MRHHRGFAGLIGAVNPAQEFQDRRLERLRAEADSIHAGASKAPQFREVDRTRIRFERNFRVALDSKPAIGGFDQRSDRFGLEQRGRAAAEENRPDRLAGPRRTRGPALELAGQRGQVVGFGPGRGRIRIEVAVRALRFAPGNMDIERERHGRPASGSHRPPSGATYNAFHPAAILGRSQPTEFPKSKVPSSPSRAIARRPPQAVWPAWSPPGSC